MSDTYKLLIASVYKTLPKLHLMILCCVLRDNLDKNAFFFSF